jgi:hypothetical protein
MKKEFYNLIKYLAIFGNLTYILFLWYNGIEDGFKFRVQSIAPIGMILLLILNIFLLLNVKPKDK